MSRSAKLFGNMPSSYGTIANVAATAAAITAVAAVCPMQWRSANRNEGSPMWAGLAKVAVIVWGAVMIFI